MELKDIIHYYLNQRCIVESVGKNEAWLFAKAGDNVIIDLMAISCAIDGTATVKPLLRKIEDLTGEEQVKIAKIVNSKYEDIYMK